MKIRIEPTGSNDESYPTVEISVLSNDVDFGTVMECLVVPALLGWGFSIDTINEYIGTELATLNNNEPGER